MARPKVSATAATGKTGSVVATELLRAGQIQPKQET